MSSIILDSITKLDSLNQIIDSIYIDSVKNSLVDFLFNLYQIDTTVKPMILNEIAQTKPLDSASAIGTYIEIYSKKYNIINDSLLVEDRLNTTDLELFEITKDSVFSYNLSYSSLSFKDAYTMEEDGFVTTSVYSSSIFL